MNIEQNFCNYQISKDLKELGMDEECLAWYDLSRNLKQNIHIWKNDYSLIKNQNVKHKLSCTAPLLQQATQFLLFKYGIHIIVDFGIGWGYQLIHNGTQGLKFSEKFVDNIDCNSPKEALIKGIQEAIRIISKST